MTARPISQGERDVIYAMIKSVDERGRQIDERWGCGRLPTLAAPDVAAAFTRQAEKFNHAVWQGECFDVQKHGEAMIRAYDKLDALATAAGCSTAAPDQWEFDTDDGLVILVRDRNRMNQAVTHGRRCQVWSLDEIANVIRNAKIVAECKMAFPGAELVETRPARKAKSEMDYALNDGIPF